MASRGDQIEQQPPAEVQVGGVAWHTWGAPDVSFSGIETKTHRPPPAGSDTAWADDDPVLAGLPVPSLSLLLGTGCLNLASCDCTDALHGSRMWVSVLSNSGPKITPVPS